MMLSPAWFWIGFGCLFLAALLAIGIVMSMKPIGLRTVAAFVAAAVAVAWIVMSAIQTALWLFAGGGA